MNQRVVVDPFNAGSKEVDAALGNAYPVVRKVYDHLQDILYVAANLENLTPHDVEIQANDDLKQIEWRYVGADEWTKLITYVDLLGADIPELIAQLNALQAQMNETAAEIEAAVPIVTTARDQALQAVIDAANASRLTLGTVVTDADHTEVSIEGPAGAQVINFTLQKGDKGTPNTLTIGTVTEGSVPAATVTGESPNQQLNLVLPRGEDGYTPNFTVGDVVTGSPGTQVEVTISGTAPDFVLDFKIPQGQSGAGTGDMLNSDNLGGLTNFAVARANLGLGNVNNTSDANKPVSVAQQAALDNKVDKVAGKALSTNDFDNASKAKLDSLNDHFKGTYTSLAALQAAVPTATAGDYAIVDAGVGADPTQYNWDASDTKWVVGGGVVTSTDVVPEGTSNLYFQAGRVRSVVLTGVTFSSSVPIVDTDTVLSAFGKTQAQINTLSTAVGGKEPALPTGGTINQFLYYDKTWKTVPGIKYSTNNENFGSSAAETITGDVTVNAGEVVIRGQMSMQGTLTVNGTLVIV